MEAKVTTRKLPDWCTDDLFRVLHFLRELGLEEFLYWEFSVLEEVDVDL